MKKIIEPEHYTKNYIATLQRIARRRTSPFKYALTDYAHEFSENPRCKYCDKRKNGEGTYNGCNPYFNLKWFNGDIVCLFTCFDCQIHGVRVTKKRIEALDCVAFREKLGRKR